MLLWVFLLSCSVLGSQDFGLGVDPLIDLTASPQTPGKFNREFGSAETDLMYSAASSCESIQLASGVIFSPVRSEQLQKRNLEITQPIRISDADRRKLPVTSKEANTLSFARDISLAFALTGAPKAVIDCQTTALANFIAFLQKLEQISNSANVNSLTPEQIQERGFAAMSYFDLVQKSEPLLVASLSVVLFSDEYLVYFLMMTSQAAGRISTISRDGLLNNHLNILFDQLISLERFTKFMALLQFFGLETCLRAAFSKISSGNEPTLLLLDKMAILFRATYVSQALPDVVLDSYKEGYSYLPFYINFLCKESAESKAYAVKLVRQLSNQQVSKADAGSILITASTFDHFDLFRVTRLKHDIDLVDYLPFINFQDYRIRKSSKDYLGDRGHFSISLTKIKKSTPNLREVLRLLEEIYPIPRLMLESYFDEVVDAFSEAELIDIDGIVDALIHTPSYWSKIQSEQFNRELWMISCARHHQFWQVPIKLLPVIFEEDEERVLEFLMNVIKSTPFKLNYDSQLVFLRIVACFPDVERLVETAMSFSDTKVITVMAYFFHLESDLSLVSDEDFDTREVSIKRLGGSLKALSITDHTGDTFYIHLF